VVHNLGTSFFGASAVIDNRSLGYDVSALCNVKDGEQGDFMVSDCGRTRFFSIFAITSLVLHKVLEICGQSYYNRGE